MNRDVQRSMTQTGVLPGEQRVQALDWEQITRDLNTQGNAVLAHLITADESQQLAALYPHDELFRSHINMAQHGFGRGEYQYFAYPLPERLARLRTTLYTHLAPIATRWNAMMGIDVCYPERHEDLSFALSRSRAAQPTPLLLQYGEGDYNCLHQDLYGEHVFPIQVMILLSEPARDFQGANSC